MEEEVKRRQRRVVRRERAQRMAGAGGGGGAEPDSGSEETERAPRPAPRRRRSRTPLAEEDIIDGFAILAFRTYEDLEIAVKCKTSVRPNSLSAKPRLPLLALQPDTPRTAVHPTPNINAHGITLLQDPGTSDDSGRASERLTGSSLAPRDPDSSRDRLSDASSRCSSGKGYICDSEGDEASPDNSRNGSPRYHDPHPSAMEDVQENGPVFRVTGGAAGTAGAGKSELAARGGSGGAVALSRAPVGGSASPAPAPLPQPAPSPAPAALPPPALPPPPNIRAELPHRPHAPPNRHGSAHTAHTAAAHIPSLDARTPAAGPDPPVTDLQQHGAGSPTPAPPAPSPLFPSHAAYPAHAALPDYRHTNHEARTKPALPPSRDPPAPLDLHHPPAGAVRPHHHHPSNPSLSNHAPHGAPHPILPGQDVRNSTTAPPTSHPSHPPPPQSFVNHSTGHANGLPHPGLPHAISASQALPNHVPPHSVVKTTSPAGHPPRPFGISTQPPTTTVPTAHPPLNINSSISTHSISYQSQSSIPQKHHVPLPSHARPHHPAFGPPNHLMNHVPPASVSHSIAQHVGHTTTNHPISLGNHSSHPTISHSIANHTVPHTSQALTNPTPSFGIPHGHRPPSLNHTPYPSPASAPPPVAATHSISIANHTEGSSAPTSISSVLAPPVPMDTRPPMSQSSTSSTESMHLRTTSPAVVVSSHAPNGYLPPPPTVYAGVSYPPLYAPYATSLQHSAHPYLPPSAASPRNTTDTRTSLAASPLVAPKTPKNIRPHTPGSQGAAGTAPPNPPPPQPPPQVLPAQHVYSPRGHSPNRERESFSSNISSLSRASGGTPVSYPSITVSSSVAPISSGLSMPPSVTLPSPLIQPLSGPLGVSSLGVPPLGVSTLGAALGAPLVTPLAAPTPTPAAPVAAHLSHTLAPVPTVPSISSSKPPAHWGVSGSSSTERPHTFPTTPAAPTLFAAPLPPPNPNPFSAESLFQTSPSADLLRRELDNRFLAAAGGAFNVRTEMHHHQHQHTHVHQHPTLATHPAPPLTHPGHAPGMFVPPPVPPMFKDVKMASLYRHGPVIGHYPYSSGLLHPGLSASTPFMPPSALSTFTPKPVVTVGAEAKPARAPQAKTGKWNAMHVRIAWEIYNHQQKGGGGSGAPGGDKDKLRASTFPPVSHAPVSHAHTVHTAHTAPPPPHAYRSPYDHLPPSPYMHHPHLGVSPFARYGAGAFPGAPPPFGLSPYATRDLPLSSMHVGHHPSSLAALHDAWRTGAPRPPAPPPSSMASSMAAAEARRDHEERERARRERESRERRDLEERERRKQREREMERVRQRSPLRNGVPETIVKDERKEMPRPPPPLAYPPPPAAWDPYRSYDLQHMRFTPLVEAAIRAEEDRAKMLSAYAAHHQQMKPGPPLLHRPLPPHPSSLAPLGSLDLLKKEEPR